MLKRRRRARRKGVKMNRCPTLIEKAMKTRAEARMIRPEIDSR